MSKTYYVYILRCRDGSYYTGITNDFERRLEEHQAGTDGKCYTTRRRPVKLVYRSEFQDVGEAIAYEKQIKRWSRSKKEAIILGRESELHMLAVCNNKTHFSYKEIDSMRKVIHNLIQNIY